jgi:hypothetical protein
MFAVNVEARYGRMINLIERIEERRLSKRRCPF